MLGHHPTPGVRSWGICGPQFRRLEGAAAGFEGFEGATLGAVEAAAKGYI
jgi:hypothetical protein